ncbi:MAG TPA: DUF5663 domain-containing protein [Patescibacteria group bacterium]|nr:DUF5663 domain-containing protein [Patescibacteria group bacterium]
MFKLDNALLEELGLGGLPTDEKNKMLAHIYETLEMRVGMKLAEQMTNEQLDEFEGFIDRNDEGGALKWLESNFPNYKQVVADELEKLKGEIKQAAPQIVAASQAALQMPPAPAANTTIPQDPTAPAPGSGSTMPAQGPLSPQATEPPSTPPAPPAEPQQPAA